MVERIVSGGRTLSNSKAFNHGSESKEVSFGDVRLLFVSTRRSKERSVTIQVCYRNLYRPIMSDSNNERPPLPLATDRGTLQNGRNEFEAPSPRRGRFLLFTAAPAWLISTLVHLLMLLVLGLVTFTDPVRVVNVLTANPTGEEGPEIEEFVIEEVDPGAMQEIDELAEPMEEFAESLEITEPIDIAPMDFAAVEVPTLDLASEMAPPMPTLQTLAAVSVVPMSSRSEDMKKKMLREYGGNESSEAAVTESLKWFSRHQAPNGNWTFSHHLVCNGACGQPGAENLTDAFNAATALAVLPFMGAGQTHLVGDFRGVVDRGLSFLIKNGKPGVQLGMPVLDLRDPAGTMYSHGLAAIALCEAYAMTEDPRLLAPAQAAVNFIVYAQCKDGGWRYNPQDKRGGDTSVYGWQLMALKSAHMGHLIVPPITIQGSKSFLDRVAFEDGWRYRYAVEEESPRASMTAVGLLCRMYTGWEKTNPTLAKGVNHLAEIGVVKDDIYHNYYAAQVMRQFGGPLWDQYNIDLRDWLVSQQETTGGGKGSWSIPSDRHSIEKMAGRLGTTSFATMILEVYYRHMPLYADSAADDEFPL